MTSFGALVVERLLEEMLQSYEYITVISRVADCIRNRSVADNGSVFVQAKRFYSTLKIRLQTITLHLSVLYT